MSVHRLALLLAAVVPLAACGSPPPTAPDNQMGSMGAPAAGPAPGRAIATSVPTAVPTPGAEADYLGKWIGPEGLVLEVKRKPGGGVTVVNQWTLNDQGVFEGAVTAEGLRFTRRGAAVVAVRGTGDATGMKWLAGKRDCLTVTPGSEGYCRS